MEWIVQPSLEDFHGGGLRKRCPGMPHRWCFCLLKRNLHLWGPPCVTSLALKVTGKGWRDLSPLRHLGRGSLTLASPHLVLIVPALLGGSESDMVALGARTLVWSITGKRSKARDCH